MSKLAMAEFNDAMDALRKVEWNKGESADEYTARKLEAAEAVAAAIRKIGEPGDTAVLEKAAGMSAKAKQDGKPDVGVLFLKQFAPRGPRPCFVATKGNADWELRDPSPRDARLEHFRLN
jgi:hypothetical protein